MYGNTAANYILGRVNGTIATSASGNGSEGTATGTGSAASGSATKGTNGAAVAR